MLLAKIFNHTKYYEFFLYMHVCSPLATKTAAVTIKIIHKNVNIFVNNV